jgi:hypothetical protein
VFKNIQTTCQLKYGSYAAVKIKDICEFYVKNCVFVFNVQILLDCVKHSRVCPLIHSDFILYPYGSPNVKFLLQIYIICLLSDENIFMPFIFFREFQMTVLFHYFNYFKGRKINPILWSLSEIIHFCCSQSLFSPNTPLLLPNCNFKYHYS